ncbi:hypothetical protein L0337_42560 [candidate division KSB1 bacterium]|nr:hypothetical protein [candidate division KSB1 bacterium]
MPDKNPKPGLDKFPDIRVTRLPDFNELGVLPLGDYFPTRADFESRFVYSGDTAVRKPIYEGWIRHRQQLVLDGLAESARQLVNGSFTTSKPNPNDIDIAVEVPVDGDMFENLQPTSPIVRLLRGSKLKEHYKCDAYPIFCLPIDHYLYESITLKSIRYWTKWFGQTREDIPKGRVWATVGGLR